MKLLSIAKGNEEALLKNNEIFVLNYKVVINDGFKLTLDKG